VDTFEIMFGEAIQLKARVQELEAELAAERAEHIETRTRLLRMTPLVDDANVRHLMRERERIELELIRARGIIDRWRMWSWRPVDLAAAAVGAVRMLERLAAIRSPDIAAEPVLPEIEKIAAEVKNTLDALLRESEPK
jgi:hypothetical protein